MRWQHSTECRRVNPSNGLQMRQLRYKNFARHLLAWDGAKPRLRRCTSSAIVAPHRPNFLASMPPQYRDVTRSVAFRLSASHAQHVSLVIRSAKGDKTSTHAMRQGVDGVWQVKVELTRGRHTYRLLVDNAPTVDPASRGNITDDHGATWSMREVGH